MSVLDDLCDLCGMYVGPGSNVDAQSSSHTGKVWCRVCHTDYSATAILIWLYNRDAPPITFPTKDTSMTPIRRPDWDTYYLGIAKAVAARGDCVRRQIGAVVVKDHRIVSTGYNGTPPGSANSCGATGQCPRNLDPTTVHLGGEYDQCWTTHAEANALLRADWASLSGSTIYITASPCSGCAKLIASAGIARVVAL